MIHVIYLAAGYSVRFGANKLLYPISGKPMYLHLLDRIVRLRDGGKVSFDITVVTQYAEIAEEMEKRGIDCAVNPDPSRGISSSIRTGIEFLMERDGIRPGDRLLFANADQPYLQEETLLLFMREAERRNAELACVSFGGEMYSPCIFSGSYVPELLALKGDTGGKRILRRYPGRVLLFEISEEEQVADIDAL